MDNSDRLFFMHVWLLLVSRWLLAVSRGLLNAAGWMIVAMVCSVPAMAVPVAWDQNQGTESQGWLSKRSENFEIFYQPKLATMAQRSLLLAEDVHNELVPFFTSPAGKVTLPSEPTRMVLVDEFDLSNGWATPIPFAQMRLYSSPPQDVNSLESSDDWLHGLIRHEYVHVLHTEMARGSVKISRNVFGRTPLLPFIVPVSPFPHALTPSMLLEGLAVYLETNKDAGYGRLQSSFYSMLMRTEVASGELQSLGEVVVTGRHFPTNRAYLYGAFFVEYLVEEYGENAVRNYLQLYSGQIIAFFMQQSSARRIFRKNFYQLWSDYQQYLIARFTPEIQRLQQQQAQQQLLQHASEIEILAQNIPVMPVFSYYNQQLLALRNNREDRQALEIIPSDPAADIQQLTPEKGIRYIDVADNQTIVAARLLTRASGRVWSDLFIWRENYGWQQLTFDQRFRKARWLNNRQVLASRNIAGISELMLLTLDDEYQLISQQLIWRGQDGDVLGDFDVKQTTDTKGSEVKSTNIKSSDIVAAIKRRGQGWNLELSHFELDSSEITLRWQKITDTRAVENSPEFLANGDIIFSADYHRIFNIYQLTPANGALQQLTYTLSGVFNPQIISNPSGEWLQYARYADDGYQIVQQRPVQTAAGNVADFYGQYNYHYIGPENNADAAAEPGKFYNLSSGAFWRSIRPHTWLPVAISNDDQSRLGVITAGTDALGRHRYSVMVNRDSEQKQWNTQLLYQYDNRWTFLFSRDHDTLSSSRIEDGELVRNIQRDDLWLLQRNIISPLWQDQLRFHLGLVREHKEIVDFPLDRDESLVGAAATFDNRQSFLDVPGVGWGSYADLIVETNDIIASEFDGNVYQGRFAHTFDLPGRAALSYDLAGGVADRGAESFVLGSSSGEEGSLFARNKYRLRGYSSGVQEGHRVFRQSLSLAFPLARIDDNWGLNPLGVADISARIFADHGSAWFRHQDAKPLTGVGVEITTEIVLGYRALLPVKIGYAKGLDEANGSTTHTYLSVGLSL